MPKKLQFPDAIRALLARRFGNQHQGWLRGEGSWPLRFALGAPSEREIAADPAAVRDWACAWQAWPGPGEVTFEERQFARLGRQRLPVGLSFVAAEDVAAAVGQAGRWSVATRRYQQMLERWPVLGEGMALASKFDVLADYSAEDFERLLALLSWLDANPESGLSIRQIPVAGLDTKWLEKRVGLVSGILRTLRGVDDETRDFHALSGLRKPAHRVRVRLLCQSLRRDVGGLCDIEAPLDELSMLPIRPKAAIIVENRETGLALPDFPGTVAIMGLGHAVSALSALPWLAEAQVVYWGDIDTHGFAILDRARRALPRLQSVLMDQQTLLAHRALWVEEPSQHPNALLEALTAEERAVYGNLRADAWGQNVRLEQERIVWREAIGALAMALNFEVDVDSSAPQRMRQPET